MNLRTLSEAARLLGIQSHRIVYAHHIGAVPEPERVCGRRAYAGDDINRLAQHFKIEQVGKEEHVSVQVFDANPGR